MKTQCLNTEFVCKEFNIARVIGMSSRGICTPLGLLVTNSSLLLKIKLFGVSYIQLIVCIKLLVSISECLPMSVCDRK